MGIYAKVRPAVDAAAAELWGRLLADKLEELKLTASPPAATAADRTGDPVAG
ncbi:MAG: hypothetical protein ACYDEN_14250 [Acidimicrobiales bacterium]